MINLAYDMTLGDWQKSGTRHLLVQGHQIPGRHGRNKEVLVPLEGFIYGYTSCSVATSLHCRA